MQKSLHMYIRICMHVLSLPLHLPHGVAKTTPPQIRFKHVLAGPVEEMHCWTKAVLRPKLPIWQPATFEHVSMCAWMYAWTHSMHANNLACCLGLQPGEDGQVALVPAIHTCMKQMHGMNAFQTNYIYIYLIRRPCFSALAVWAGLSEQEEVPVATMVLVLAVALGAAVVVQQVLAADLQQVLLVVLVADCVPKGALVQSPWLDEGEGP